MYCGFEELDLLSAVCIMYGQLQLTTDKLTQMSFSTEHVGHVCIVIYMYMLQSQSL